MKRRPTYVPLRIDFTPFVSIALLLIVFFLWTKTIRKPIMIRASIPDNQGCYWGELPKPDAHVFLLNDNRIGFLTYRSDGSNAEFVETNFSANGIGKQLMSISLNHDYGAVIIISPTDQATFKNIVDVLDELQILGNISYYLASSLTGRERKMLKNYENYRATYPKEVKLVRMPLYTEKIWSTTFTPVKHSL